MTWNVTIVTNVSGADLKRSRNVGVCTVGCPRTATKFSSLSTGPPILPFYPVFCGLIGLVTSSSLFSAHFIAFLPLFSSSPQSPLNHTPTSKSQQNTFKSFRITLSLIYTL